MTRGETNVNGIFDLSKQREQQQKQTSQKGQTSSIGGMIDTSACDVRTGYLSTTPAVLNYNYTQTPTIVEKLNVLTGILAHSSKKFRTVVENKILELMQSL